MAESVSHPPLVIGAFRDRESAERAYRSLLDRGYTRDDIVLLMSEEARRQHFGGVLDTDLGSRAAEGAGVGAVAGGGLGAVLGGLAAMGAVALPGLGVLAIGPLAAAMAGGAAGAASGSLAGALVGLNLPEDRARGYETAVREGRIVLGVRPRCEDHARQIEREWRLARAERNP
jgi:hypothetical protein